MSVVFDRDDNLGLLPDSFAFDADLDQPRNAFFNSLFQRLCRVLDQVNQDLLNLFGSDLNLNRRIPGKTLQLHPGSRILRRPLLHVGTGRNPFPH